MVGAWTIDMQCINEATGITKCDVGANVGELECLKVYTSEDL